MACALCDSAEIGGIRIGSVMIGGLGAMAPERRGEIVALGLRSIASGILAALMTAVVIGMLL